MGSVAIFCAYLLKNIHESASIGLLTDNKIYLTKENLKTVDSKRLIFG